MLTGLKLTHQVLLLVRYLDSTVRSLFPIRAMLAQLELLAQLALLAQQVRLDPREQQVQLAQKA